MFVTDYLKIITNWKDAPQNAGDIEPKTLNETLYESPNGFNADFY